MDPVGAGASVLAFVVLALKSANAIHQVLSAIKDGPEVLRHLVGEIAQLQGILKRLSRLQPGSVDDGDMKALETAARRCTDDVKDMESRLQRLSIRPTDRRPGKFWKRLVTVVDEKDLMRMQTIVRCHLMMLSVHLGLLQAVQMSASQSQWSEILENLSQLKEEVSSLRARSALPADARAVASEAAAVSNLPDAQPVNSELEQAISRLVGLIGEKEGTVASDDAQQMLDDLQVLLQLAEREEEKAQSYGCDLCDKGQDVSQDLKLVLGLLASAPVVAINEALIRQTHIRKSIETSGGSRLALSTIRRSRRHRDASGHQDGDLETGEVDFIAKVVFHPARQNSTLVISVKQAQLAAGSYLSIPSLSVHNIIPSNSPVFRLAGEGKIGDILGLVANGKANLQDRDEQGWSLLHHGANHPELCAFLIQHGLDVDEIARDKYGDEYSCHILGPMCKRCQTES
ncbi:Peroxisomal NADH pyrophosphatase NUDT12 [Madurella mycetomatis]|uniref:Peroxisomal NADH pyrophosphatase NUDT12 n=1 Tax=Madurella mycetomatis TaxID=100816 RepID=A0A175VVU9_9PEZI|nr:Peroxisomal NADH pyrophosphatase NUDT12 [Madurella mycetomatis]